MKTLFIHAKSSLPADVVKRVKFKGKLGLVTTIQHVHKLKGVKKLIPNSVIGGQVIGCNISNAKKIAPKVKAFLFIGSGNFHPLKIAMETGKEVFTADPYTNNVGKISREDIEERKRRQKGAYLTYLHAEKVGILVSTKKGQNKLKEAQRLKNKLKKEEKAAFIFIFDTLDFNQLESFTEIDCWVNTACPRMAIEDSEKFLKPVINIEEIFK